MERRQQPPDSPGKLFRSLHSFLLVLFYDVASQSLNAAPAFYCLCVTERDTDDSILPFGKLTPVTLTPAPVRD